MNSARTPRSAATSEATRFSSPSPRLLESGMLFGSTQNRMARRSLAAAGSTAARMSTAILWEREDIECAAVGSMLRQILHGIDKTQRTRAVLRVQAACHHRTRPAAYAREYGHELFAVGTTV